MCGIFGWVAGPAAMIDTTVVLRDLVKSLRHRGPDDCGWLAIQPDGTMIDSRMQSGESTGAGVLLGQTRLSIIDLSPAGHQPMISDCGRFAITQNGEIYNYRELREELIALGRNFTTKTDTEVLLAAFREWGIKCLLRFQGMFAFAILDRAQKRLYCVRDFFGIKPFFYSELSGRFCFASELPAMLLHLGTSRTTDPQRIYDYLTRGDVDSGEHSMVQGIRYLPPAHYLVVDCETCRVVAKERYWRPSLESRDLPYQEAVKELRGLLATNIERHLRSDVPVGAALSGGVDSSAIVCGVKQVAPLVRLQTFTYVAGNQAQSEERWADMVCAHAGAVGHKTQDAEPDSLMEEMEDLVHAQGEPFASTSIYAQYRVFKLARQCGIKVLLEGQGADELFAGYLGFPGERLNTLLKAGRLLAAARFFRNTSRWPGRGAKQVLQMAANAMLPPALIPVARRIGGRKPCPAWMSARWFRSAEIDPAPAYLLEMWDQADGQELKRALARRLCIRGLPNLLRHGDRNAMRFSIENRVPFLTREMAEFAMSLPESFLVDESGRTKAVLKDALTGWLPEPVLNRRDKIGFATSEASWLRALDASRSSLIEQIAALGIFEVDTLREFWNGALLRGDARSTAFVWRWINLAKWVSLLNIKPPGSGTLQALRKVG